VPDIGDALKVIHQAGGRSFLAHPLTGRLTVHRLEALLTWLEPQGLDGVEAFYKAYSDETQRVLLEMAKRRRLLVSAGSDYHGLHSPGENGPGVDVPLVHWQRFLTALGLE
jgi:predicted metal-dependent phosphoesterase TrpH